MRPSGAGCARRRLIVVKRLAVVALIALVSGGCAYMRFQRPPSEEIVKCGIVQTPFWYWLAGSEDAVFREATCIEQREAEGYQAILPEPYFFVITAGSLYTGQPTYTKMP
jgi:hypothetical protein